MRSRIEGLNSTSSFIKNIDSIHTKCHAIPAHPFHVSTWKTEQNKKKSLCKTKTKKLVCPLCTASTQLNKQDNSKSPSLVSNRTMEHWNLNNAITTTKSVKKGDMTHIQNSSTDQNLRQVLEEQDYVQY